MTIPFVRTPDDRFTDLSDFPYAPAYAEVEGLRMAYVDEGSGDEATFLLVHGEPTWGYLSRRMISPPVDAGVRVIADRIPGAAGQPHQTFEPGGHFLQDDCGEAVVQAVLDWMATPTKGDC